jgi:hypothetical protein
MLLEDNIQISFGNSFVSIQLPKSFEALEAVAGMFLLYQI